MSRSTPADDDTPAEANAAPSPPPSGLEATHHAGQATTQGVSPTDGAARSPASYRRGDSLGRYLILEILGQGGMGAVYSAYDPELDRRVALKLLRTAGASDDARKRLIREARALAKLSHPNVVQVHDAGEHQGNVFIAMELVEGISLREWAKTQNRWQDILAVYLQAARGLAAAHAAGLVHRDIKPANIVLGKASPQAGGDGSANASLGRVLNKCSAPR